MMTEKREKAFFSEKTVYILLLLNDRPMTSLEISEKLGVFPSYLYAYLKFLKNKGLITRNSFNYTLTDTGKEFVNKYYNHFIFILQSKYGINITKYNKTKQNITKHSEKSNKLYITKKIQEITEKIKQQISYKDIREDPCVHKLIEFLVKQRLETGDLYWIAPSIDFSMELADKINCSSSYIGSILKVLVSDKIVFLRKDSSLNLPKIRLHRRFDHLFRNQN